MKDILIVWMCFYIFSGVAQAMEDTSEDLNSTSYWNSEQIFNQVGQLNFSRASIKDENQQMILALDYHPKHNCRLKQATIFILSEEPQTQMLPLSIFGKMQIDEQLVHSIEMQVNSHAGDKFIHLIIPRPDLDQLLFSGKNVMFYLNNYGFMNFSLKNYQNAIRETIPACEQYIFSNEDNKKK